MVKMTIEANAARDKTESLNRIDVGLEQFRFLVRTAAELRMMPTKQYEHVSKLASEIGKLIGGMKRKFK